MTRTLTILGTCALLCACGDSEAVKQAKWQAFCTQHEFTDKQCEVLYVLKSGDEEAANEASWAANMSAASFAASIASSGARR